MPTPANEHDRLTALRSYQILDTEAEAAFDDLVKVAAHVMDVPVALVSLVDDNRQWCKARHGLGTQRVPRKDSFCAHVVASEMPLIVHDALDDPRFCSNPLVMGTVRVRFYAGMPLRAPGGFVLGTLCVIDHEPRQPTPKQLEMLKALAAQVMDQLEARKTRHALDAAIDRMSRQERVATLGVLAAGVGHEINNPLAYVMCNLDFALEELRELSGPAPSLRLREVQDMLGEARDGAERIRKIVRGLRSLSREGVTLHALDVCAAIDTSLNMAAHEIRNKALVLEKLGNVPQVLTDESRLTQILVNFMVNAAQAFEHADPTHNRITVATSLHSDGRVIISVTDNGPGIPEAIQRRIFDPFFTTKPVGQGTGLGLSVSRSLVTSLGGELHVESTEGKGSTFSIILPVAPSTVDEQALAPAPSPVRGRVLVVDDDVSVLNTIRRILARDHDVVAMNDARQALSALERESFDLVLCNLMMPYLSGQQLYARAVELGSGIADRFVFVTGGATNAAEQSFLAHVSNERLEKPFAPQNLLGIARRFVRNGEQTLPAQSALPRSAPRRITGTRD